MPGLNGRDMAGRIQGMKPGLPVLFMTGFDKEESDPHGDTGACVLQKPFTPEALVARVADFFTGAPGRTILVVDDEPAVRRVMREILEPAGYSVEEASDGRSALQLLHTRAFDILLTDLVMPDQEGLETVQTLRSEGKAIKIIAMSGADSRYLRIARMLGADEILPKPASDMDVLAAVERVLAG
jgi:CheY-like chemotaxis protein